MLSTSDRLEASSQILLSSTKHEASCQGSNMHELPRQDEDLFLGTTSWLVRESGLARSWVLEQGELL